MHSKITRSEHFWYFFTGIIILSFIMLVNHYINTLELSPKALRIVDSTYIILRDLSIISIITNIVSFMFLEVKLYIAINRPVIRKFLPTIRFVVIIIIWIGGIFFILDQLRVNITAIMTGAGIGGAIFALASKDIIANLLGSISILMSRTFEIGETIRIKTIEGIVEEITLNYTKVMGTDGKVIFIPNRVINVENIENLTRRRFYQYVLRVPFKKSDIESLEVKRNLQIIEGKINDYYPISTAIETEFPNVNDAVYVFTVNLPEENKHFETEMRTFLMEYIFPNKKIIKNPEDRTA